MNSTNEALIKAGRAWVFGDNVMIEPDMMPLSMTHDDERDMERLVSHLMVALDPEFPKRVSRNDVIIAGEMFGGGNYHPQAIHAMRYLGLGIVAESVARGFFRMAVWCGVPILSDCRGVRQKVRSGQQVTIDFVRGRVETEDETLSYPPMDSIIQEFTSAGGERTWLCEQVAEIGARGR